MNVNLRREMRRIYYYLLTILLVLPFVVTASGKNGRKILRCVSGE